MDRLFTRINAIVLVLVACASADALPDETMGSFKDDFLENLVGKWTITRAIRGTEVMNSLKAEWILNHQFLQLHMKDTADPPKYEAIVVIGYQDTNKRYVAH